MHHLKEALRMLESIGSPWFRQLVAAALEEAEFVVDYLLRDFGIRPLVVGGLAVQRYGYQRFTQDIDLLVSAQDFGKLSDAGKVENNNLIIRPGLRVELLVAGEMDTPDPEEIRDGESAYPTLEGLIYLKLLAQRQKDSADIVELLKLHQADTGLAGRVKQLVPPALFEDFEQLQHIASLELGRQK